MTALDRLEAVTAELEGAGAQVVSATPLAHPTDPHVIVAHDVRVSSPTPQVHSQATAILATHRVPTDGLIPWQDPEAVEEGAGDEIDSH